MPRALSPISTGVVTLTKHRNIDQTVSRQADVVTEKMVEAGVCALEAWRDVGADHQIAIAVYTAMLAAKDLLDAARTGRY